MSHNQTTVGGQSPNSAGEISVALNDLSDVSGSPSTGEALVYDGSGWAPASIGAVSTTLPYSAYVSDQSSWGAGSYKIITGHWVSWRKYSARNDMIGGPYNTTFWMSSSTAHTSLSNTKWCMGFKLPSGKWIVRGVLNVRHSNSTNYLEAGWFDGAGNQYGNIVRSMRGRSAGSCIVWGLIDISSLTEVFIKCTYASHATGLQIPTPAETRCIAYQFIKIG